MINKYIPSKVKYQIKRLLNKSKWKGENKIFCLSMQKTGTTSVGDFFKHFGYPVAKWHDSLKNKWPQFWHEGNFKSIFESKIFLSYQVFEDDPWWYPEFYKVLYHKFPNSKFILFIRDSDSWYESMVSHSNYRGLGSTKEHCKIYRREKEFYYELDNNENFNPIVDTIGTMFSLVGHKQHYKNIYEIRNREIIDFFKEKNSTCLFTCNLNDPNKWKKLGDFMEIIIPSDFKIHSNKSDKPN